jgi:DNA-binding PadR family transcriptional regulator
MGQALPVTAYALLGLLTFGQELTGYQLKQWADSSLRFFWVSPAMSHVYRELDRLEEAGLVRSRSIEEGERTSRVFSITARGRRALERWLAATPVEMPLLKHSIALRLFLGHVVGRDRTRATLESYLDVLSSRRGDLEAVRASLGDDPTFASAALVADWGLRYYDFEAAMTKDLIARLDEIRDGER